jgi:hypothetical protein
LTHFYCIYKENDSTQNKPGLYEPIHGSAPDISGQGVANPIGAILSVAMMLRYSLGLPEEAGIVENAVRTVLDQREQGGLGLRTGDLGGTIGTQELTAKICQVLRESLGYLRAEQFRQSIGISRGLSAPLSADNELLTPLGRRPMTLCEKIIAHHCVDLSTPGHVRPGDVVCVRVDWTLASELTWKGCFCNFFVFFY